MSYKILEGKKGIIFGALDENSIAWKTAESVTEAGGSYVLTNAPVALRMGNINILAENTGSQVIAADATKGTKVRCTAAVGSASTGDILWVAEYVQPAGTAPAVA